MCGIAGLVQPGLPEEEWSPLLKAMTRTLQHRGPDGEGIWVDAEAGVGLGHRRLAIIDLSPSGWQPMASRNDRYRLTFNGEIFNFRELRQELQGRGHDFVGTSDTEVILAAIDSWGFDEALARLNGQFAMALWDRSERTLRLVRDRLGEKPLYYGFLGGPSERSRAFLFASELKAFQPHPAYHPTIDRNSLALMLRYSYIPAPHTIYQGVYKLPPASVLTLKLDDFDSEPVVESYWSARQVAHQGLSSPFQGSDSEALALTEKALAKSIELRMISDVPLGAFLSGGVDSSLVVALMQAASSQPVKTFSIGFEIDGYDEAPHARAVASHLGTEHTELYVTADQALDVIPRLPTIYDEPFSDCSQIPTFLVSQLARKEVTVALSGDGGDELFWGYSRYPLCTEIWKRIGWLPTPLRRTAAAALDRAPLGLLDVAFSWMGPLFTRYGRPGSAGDKLRKFAEVARMGTPDELYRHILTNWRNVMEVVPGSQEVATNLNQTGLAEDLPGFQERMPYLDQVSYLPDDILAKVDRASMANSLEVRVPFLDPSFVELSWQLPPSLKMRGGEGKWLLRQILARHVPRALTDRPKMGFGVPVGSWLRDPLRAWGEELLSEERLRREGFFEAKVIRAKWQEHLSGQRNWQYHLWDVLMFQAWLEAQG
ncbi:MAG: asparagine synthase (glutamine-hydrolyzing) [Deltaproteobacteria bacterium]|nr:asparagine synthase (glutamine-hydrolyzing) [Deltaproteobacteria bacterium]